MEFRFGGSGVRKRVSFDQMSPGLRFFVVRIFPLIFVVVGVALIVFGVFAGAFTRPCEKPSVWENIKKVIAVIAVVVGIYGLVVSMIGSRLFMPPGLRFGPSRGEVTGLEIDWLHSFERATERAKAEDKPIMIDFYAENCPACIEMDRFTYSNAEVAEGSKGFIAAKLYANDNKNIVRKYGILGYPAAVFLKPDGKQIGETAYGFIEADRFLKLMDKAGRHY